MQYDLSKTHTRSIIDAVLTIEVKDYVSKTTLPQSAYVRWVVQHGNESRSNKLPVSHRHFEPITQSFNVLYQEEKKKSTISALKVEDIESFIILSGKTLTIGSAPFNLLSVANKILLTSGKTLHNVRLDLNGDVSLIFDISLSLLGKGEKLYADDHNLGKPGLVREIKDKVLRRILPPLRGNLCIANTDEISQAIDLRRCVDGSDEKNTEESYSADSLSRENRSEI